MSVSCCWLSIRLLVLLVSLGCLGEKVANSSDSAAVEALVSPVVVPAVVNPGWNQAAGPLIVLPDLGRPSVASVVLPLLTDSMLADTRMLHIDSLLGLRMDLYSRGGKVGESTLIVGADRPGAENCLHWPKAQLRDQALQEWKVGFVKNHTAAISLDSLEGMNGSDSVHVTTELARLASKQPESSDPDFQGLPFAVRKAYRFSVGSISVLVGNIVRKINLEANPRDENILLIAERMKTERIYQKVYYKRVAGSEDIVQTSEVLAAVMLMDSGRPFLVLSLEDAEGGRAALLERAGSGVWKITWRSAYTGC